MMYILNTFWLKIFIEIGTRKTTVKSKPRKLQKRVPGIYKMQTHTQRANYLVNVFDKISILRGRFT